MLYVFPSPTFLGLCFLIIALGITVELPGKVVDLRSGFSHAVAVLENGDVYTWGKMQGVVAKTEGRVPVFEDQLYPRKVDIVGGGRAVEAFCSSFNTLLRMEDGRILMSGLEADTRKPVHTPVEVSGMKARRCFVMVPCGLVLKRVRVTPVYTCCCVLAHHPTSTIAFYFVVFHVLPATIVRWNGISRSSHASLFFHSSGIQKSSSTFFFVDNFRLSHGKSFLSPCPRVISRPP